MNNSKRLASRDRAIPNCNQCNAKLGKYRLDGKIDGVKMSFCGFKCHDDFKDGVKNENR